MSHKHHCVQNHWQLRYLLNTLRAIFSRRHFQMDFFNKNIWISLRNSLKFVLKVRINNIPALVKIMAWRGPGNTPLSEPMMVSLLTHICVTWPQWVNRSFIHSVVYQGKHQSSMTLVLCAGKPLLTSRFPAQRASNAENVYMLWLPLDLSHDCPSANEVSITMTS